MFEDGMPEAIETRAAYIDIAEHERLAGMPADDLAVSGTEEVRADYSEVADAM